MEHGQGLVHDDNSRCHKPLQRVNMNRSRILQKTRTHKKEFAHWHSRVIWPTAAATQLCDCNHFPQGRVNMSEIFASIWGEEKKNWAQALAVCSYGDCKDADAFLLHAWEVIPFFSPCTCFALETEVNGQALLCYRTHACTLHVHE